VLEECPGKYLLVKCLVVVAFLLELKEAEVDEEPLKGSEGGSFYRKSRLLQRYSSRSLRSAVHTPQKPTEKKAPHLWEHTVVSSKSAKRNLATIRMDYY
jgi:hypothetical protein